MSAGVFNHNWYNRNELRQYPLDITATGIDDFDLPVTTSLLADVNLHVPSDLGVTEVYVGGGHVTSQVASVVLTGVTPSGRVPLCCASATGQGGRLQAVDAIADGVRGWVVFGSVYDDDGGRWTFSTPEQSRLSADCWRTYRQAPVTSVGTPLRQIRLTGDVVLEAGGDLEFVVEERMVRGQMRPGIIVRMSRDMLASRKAAYLGECVDTTGICSPAPVKFLNKVGPDASGNITVEIKGIDRRLLVDSEGRAIGIALESPVGLIDICDTDKGLTFPDIEVPEC